MKLGDIVYVLLHSRTHGSSDTGGGWSSDWVMATIQKINPKTIDVYTHKYYFGHHHRVQKDRVRSEI